MYNVKQVPSIVVYDGLVVGLDKLIPKMSPRNDLLDIDQIMFTETGRVFFTKVADILGRELNWRNLSTWLYNL